MELGATVCTPRNPQCLVCPVREHCQAREAGIQERIPPVRKAKATPLEVRVTVCVRRGEEWLIERRPAEGRWAGMWQFVTRPAVGGVAPPAGKGLSKAVIRALIALETTPGRPVGLVTHGLTHRRYEFHVFACELVGAAGGIVNDRRQEWVTLGELDRYPLPRPQLKIAALLGRAN
jgi:A/G-specific adenine glycosylase